MIGSISAYLYLLAQANKPYQGQWAPVDGFHSDVTKFKVIITRNSYLHYVEDKQKVILCTSFHSRSMFHFENTAI